MAMSDGLQILRAIERQHDLFRSMQEGIMLDINSGDIYIVRGKMKSYQVEAAQRVSDA